MFDTEQGDQDSTGQGFPSGNPKNFCTSGPKGHPFSQPGRQPQDDGLIADWRADRPAQGLDAQRARARVTAPPLPPRFVWYSPPPGSRAISPSGLASSALFI